ncbi:MAG: hypothetical protein QOI63_404, partial [Thermoplasmata archaeon]|nr:hypothetical protein [Thermoplasmata archaeon]
MRNNNERMLKAIPAMFLVVLLAVPLASATPATVIVSAGPLSNIWIGNELSCQVKHVNDASYQFY